jgi:DNA (cytosine-5)-methyltransferase 1
MTSAILRLMEELGRERPTAASLFSGIGGMDLGFQQAGFDILWANEVDQSHAEVHRNNFPNIPMLETSIHMLSTDELIDKYGQPDVLFGGFPCTTYSRAADISGKRWTDAKPKRDYKMYAAEGGDLFLHMRRFIGDMQPKAFVIENVTELSGCRIIMETLKNTPCSITGERLGRYYTFHYGEVNTKDYGVAQNRKRMFVIGINHKVARPILEKKELIQRHIVGEILEEEPNYTWDTERFPVVNNFVQSRIDGDYRDKPSIKEIGEGVIGNTCIAHYRKDRGTTVVRRADGTLMPYSPREYANLQGFPAEFQLSSGLKMYSGIGNAVSVPVGRAVAEAIAPLITEHGWR